MVQNKGLIYKSAPEGTPVPGKDLAIEVREFDVDQAPPAGGVTVKNHYISFDPYQRGRMRDPARKSYAPPFTLDEPITNAAVARIIKSDNPKFKAGDLVTGMLPTEEYTALPKDAASSLNVIQNPYKLDEKEFLASLGMPGLTAYSSFYAIGKPKKGETIFISAASGAVGALVGQLAKHEGLTVIGSVGSDEKLDFITKELKFDGGFNYKTEKPADALARLAPEGIDIYYENVGGEQLSAAFDAFKTFGRVIACGMISQYNIKPDEQYGLKNLMQIVAKRLTIRGFIVSDADMGPVYYQERNERISKWLSEGTFQSKIHVVDGIDNGAEGFVGMLAGKNFGKTVLKIADVVSSPPLRRPSKILLTSY
ncbi:zinc-binding dehydrogenase [Phlyctema vagabunda]|uniref:Zinc-binding dehydrogenase n=1 Tax=Phlyctema vagabunda TaxID=108571 RepID=A0ABR4PFM4_9HELO